MDMNSLSTILEPIQYYAEKFPAHIAVEFEDETLTYEQVNRLSNQLAHYLNQQGVKAETPVGLCVTRSIDLVIGMLGIFKAGGTYIPLDPEHPAQRISDLVKDTHVQIVLTHKKFDKFFSASKTKLVVLDSVWKEIKCCSEKKLPQPSANQVSYVMFTSGTTGKPKGVEIEHKTFAIRYGFSPYFHLMSESDCLAAITAVSWNPSVYEIFYTLARGARIVMCSTETVKDPYLLQKFLEQKKITFMRAVPSLWQALVDAGWKGKNDLIIVSHGEKLEGNLGEKLQVRGKGVYNTYGSTEATVFSLVQVTKDQKRVIPLVSSSERGEIMVLDENLKPVSQGEVGELYIAGQVIAKGYFEDQKLTEEKFIWNQNKTARLYRTGDLARTLSNGNLEFLGRADNQVKIRGQRIELGEIEAVIAKFPKVKNVVVHTGLDGVGGTRLIAYIIPVGPLIIGRLRKYLEDVLPTAMIPSQFICIEYFPLNENGKVNRKALPQPSRDHNYTELPFVAAQTQTELHLTKIFEEILNLNQIGIDDHFFDLGGHSLSAALVCSRLRENLKVDISLATFFQAPTVRSLAQEVEQFKKNGERFQDLKIEKVVNREIAPLSSAQERLLFMNKLTGDDAGYNLPMAIRLEGKLHVKALNDSLSYILERHEALRTSFQLDKEGKPYQTIHVAQKFDLPIIDFKKSKNAEEDVRSKIALDAKINFNLGKSPLIRGSLYQLKDDVHVLYINIHHIVSDGWSKAIFIRELIDGYKAFAISEKPQFKSLPIQYVDYASWHRSFLEGQELKRQKQYWVKELLGIEPLNMPTDRARPKILSQNGDQEILIISSALLNKLHVLAKKQNTSLYMVLLSAYKLLLYRYSGQLDIAVGSPIAGRVRPELEGLIGFFVNTLIMRSKILPTQTFTMLLRQVKDKALSAYANQDLPFEQLVSELNPERDLSRYPLTQTIFAFQNTPYDEVDWDQLKSEPFSFRNQTTRFDMELHCWERDEGLRCHLIYNTDLFDQWRMKQFLLHYNMILESVALDAETPIYSVPLLLKQEYQKIVYDWNQTKVSFDEEMTIHRLVEEQAEIHADRLAVCTEDKEYTYRELNDKANQLANYLIHLGVQSHDRVAICLPRCFDLFVSELAILKVGATYVPIDPDYPLQRLHFMLSDCKANIVLGYEDLLGKFSLATTNKICLRKNQSLIAQQAIQNLKLKVTSDFIAYIIYTSGSTGQPNGVMVPHKGLVNLIVYNHKLFKITSNDRFNYISSPSFDASVVETWVPLSIGASVHIADNDTRIILPKLINWLELKQISFCFLSTNFLEQTFSMQIPSCVRQLSAGGDRLRLRPPKNFPQVVNYYGPTENSCVSTLHIVESQDDKNQNIYPSIGRPVANQQAYIVDSQLNPVPIGVAGELVMGGVGVVPGYVDRPELTAKKFIPNPFGEGKLYRTGDMARYLPDGRIEFLGRVDHQVKIRGYRIEPGEVTSAILEFEGVKDAFTMMREDIPGDKRLVSYIVMDDKVENVDLATKHVDQWQELYEREYDQEVVEDTSFNIKGWNSSFTGEAYSSEAMREWVDCTVNQIKAFSPEKIMEIGCGTGLLLFPLSQIAKKYSAIDISTNTIEKIRKTLEKSDLREKVDVYVSPAHDFSWIEKRPQFDTAIINSVIQYFPSANYLENVISGIAERIVDGGRIFVGDVRNFDLLHAFHLTVELYKAQDTDVTINLETKLETRIQLDKELLLSPRFFYELEERIPRVSAVEVRPKRGRHKTEMNMYRYDVVLHIGKPKIKISPNVYQFNQMIGSISSLERILSNISTDILVKGITDRRIGNILLALNDLRTSKQNEKLSQFKNRYQKELGLDIEDLIQLASKFRLKFDIRFGNTSDTFDILYTSKGNENGVLWWQESDHWSQPTTFYNDPLQHKKVTLIRPKIREFLSHKIPDYMMPSFFIFIDQIPITTNGKIDQKALPAPQGDRPELLDSFVAPVTEIEKTLANIFAQALGVDLIGTKDNFFELGGHSLLAVQVVSKIEELLKTEISMTTFFEGPTVEKLVPHINGQSISNTLNKEQEKEIEKEVKKLPLTPMDASFYYLRLFLKRKEQTWYQVMELKVKPLDRIKLEKAVNYAIKRHPIARGRLSSLTAFGRDVYWNVVDLNDTFMLDYHEVKSESELSTLREIIINSPFELNEAPSCRFVLVKTPDVDYLMLRYHHGALDASGLQCLFNSVMAHYLDMEDPVKRVLPLTIDELLHYYNEEKVPFIHGNELAHVKALLPAWLFSARYKPRFKTSIFKPKDIFPAKIFSVGGNPSDDRCTAVELLFSIKETETVTQLAKNLKSTLDRVFMVGILQAVKQWNVHHSGRSGRVEAYWAVNLRPPKFFDSIVANQFGWSRVRMPEPNQELAWKKEILNPNSNFLIRGAIDWLQSVNTFHFLSIPVFIRKFLMALAGIGSPSLYISNTLTVSVTEVEKSSLSEAFGVMSMKNHSKFGASNRPVMVIGRENSCIRLRMVYPCHQFNTEAAKQFLETCKQSILQIEKDKTHD